MPSPRKIRVLLLGYIQGTFLVPFYQHIKRGLPELEVDVCDYCTLAPGGAKAASEVFSTFLQVPRIRADPPSLVSLARAGFGACLYGRLWRSLAVKPGRMVHEFSRAAKIGYLQRLITQRTPYNVFHFHMCSSDNAGYIDALPKGARAICSFWGSDLLRSHGLYNYWYQTRLLERCDLITIQAPELEEVVLAKFGRHLKPKIRRCFFPLDEDFYRLMDRLRDDKARRSQFRQFLGADPGMTVVAAGHNGNPQNNHLAIITALAGLPPDRKRSLLVVFPMTYGAHAEHQAAVRRAATDAGLNFRVLTDYVEAEQVALLRLTCDILIHVPVSDALCWTGLETMYAGNVLLAGSWLPYSPYRRAGVPYQVVDEIPELTAVLTSLWPRLNECKKEMDASRDRFRSHFFPEQTSRAWIEAYRSLANCQ